MKTFLPRKNHCNLIIEYDIILPKGVVVLLSLKKF